MFLAITKVPSRNSRQIPCLDHLLWIGEFYATSQKCPQILFFFFFFNRCVRGFTPNRSLGHCTKRPLHTGRVKLKFSHVGVASRNYLFKEGRTLDLMLHDILRPSDFSLEPTPWGYLQILEQQWPLCKDALMDRNEHILWVGPQSLGWYSYLVMVVTHLWNPWIYLSTFPPVLSIVQGCHCLSFLAMTRLIFCDKRLDIRLQALPIDDSSNVSVSSKEPWMSSTGWFITFLKTIDLWE